eukprot:Clim_evm63s88 gene=Clim_evmTU63s88
MRNELTEGGFSGPTSTTTMNGTLPEQPAQMFDSVDSAIEDFKAGKMVLVVDNENRENEGDLIMAAELATPEALAFIVRYTTGIVCVSVDPERLEQLGLPLMVEENTDTFKTAFTVTVDYKVGTTTGVSAADRAKTINALANPEIGGDQFNKPGHIFPLRPQQGGVLTRPGHTEAGIDLCRMSGLFPAAALCEVTMDNGVMARRDDLYKFKKEFGLKMITIEQMIAYRKANKC